MQAMVIKQYGGTDQLCIEEVPLPKPNKDEILIRVRAFGINRAETYMRRGLWGDVAKVSGIECVGEVEDDPSGRLTPGQKVAAIMGGMGRTRNGSYAEFTCVPAANVFALQTNMAWIDLAAIPESYATAWSCLHENMKLTHGDTILIRGGTSALGQAAINIAVNTDRVTVIASTRDKDNIALLKSIGSAEVLIEGEDLSARLKVMYPQGINGVLDIVGNTTLLDSLKMVKKGGYVCNAGFLAGGNAIPFNPLMDLPSSVNLNFFASFMLGTKDFPLSSIPMQAMVDRAFKGYYKAKPVKVFDFAEIPAAHALMESNNAHGKIVVRL
ncbi:MAG: zinc-binding dehydrogenase [Gammaproteobacteria bacterium]|nr:zinc-binding dehydrogenase [Gammaproteobacteria bacterium]